jgi:hypothetical protein
MTAALALSDLSTASGSNVSQDAAASLSNFDNSKFAVQRDALMGDYKQWLRSLRGDETEHQTLYATEHQNGVLSSEPKLATSSTAQRALRPALDLNPPPTVREVRRAPTFSPLQEWEGYVTEVTRTHIIANLVSLSEKLSGSTSADLRAEIPLEELSEDDVRKVARGRVFRWAIGYQRTPQGTKMRVSQIVFRNLPQWTSRELAAAAKEAGQLHEFFMASEVK